jgi:predicted nicotinamide N-methyase
VLELGAGVGVPGLVAARKARRVCLSDGIVLIVMRIVLNLDAF